MKHTPEPWRHRDGEVYQEWSGRTVARCNIGGRDYVTEANGERIAACVNGCTGINPEAVPYLLDALELLLERATSLPQGATHDGLSNCTALAKARAAITKAKT